jgi:hypothetical protein
VRLLAKVQQATTWAAASRPVLGASPAAPHNEQWFLAYSRSIGSDVLPGLNTQVTHGIYQDGVLYRRLAYINPANVTFQVYLGHPDGTGTTPGQTCYMDALSESWASSGVMEFRMAPGFRGEIVAVGQADHASATSAVAQIPEHPLRHGGLFIIGGGMTLGSAISTSAEAPWDYDLFSTMGGVSIAPGHNFRGDYPRPTRTFSASAAGAPWTTFGIVLR